MHHDMVRTMVWSAWKFDSGHRDYPQFLLSYCWHTIFILLTRGWQLFVIHCCITIVVMVIVVIIISVVKLVIIVASWSCLWSLISSILLLTKLVIIVVMGGIMITCVLMLRPRFAVPGVIESSCNGESMPVQDRWQLAAGWHSLLWARHSQQDQGHCPNRHHWSPRGPQVSPTQERRMEKRESEMWSLYSEAWSGPSYSPWSRKQSLVLKRILTLKSRNCCLVSTFLDLVISSVCSIFQIHNWYL